MNKYPEHAKLSAVVDQSQIVGAFMEWLEDKKLELGLWDEDEFRPANKKIQELLSEYFEIDEKRLEQEKVKMLKALRAAHK